MFGLGFFEIILILAGILIFVRPKDLPKFVYRVGKVYGQVKEAYNKFYREINIMKNQIDEIVEREKKLVLDKKDNKTDSQDKSSQQTPLNITDSSNTKPADSVAFEPKSKKLDFLNSKKTTSKKRSSHSSSSRLKGKSKLNKTVSKKVTKPVKKKTSAKPTNQTSKPKTRVSTNKKPKSSKSS